MASRKASSQSRKVSPGVAKSGKSDSPARKAGAKGKKDASGKAAKKVSTEPDGPWEIRSLDVRKWGQKLNDTGGTNPGAVKKLVHTLKDSRSMSEGLLRRTAIEALVPAAALGSRAALTQQAIALTDKSEHVRRVAIDALLGAAGGRRPEMGGAVAVALSEHMPPQNANWDVDVRRAGAEALRMLAPKGDPDMIALATKWLKDEDPAVRLSAMRALGEIGSSVDDVEAVTAFIGDPDWQVNRAAIHALQRLGARGKNAPRPPSATSASGSESLPSLSLSNSRSATSKGGSRRVSTGSLFSQSLKGGSQRDDSVTSGSRPDSALARESSSNFDDSASFDSSSSSSFSGSNYSDARALGERAVASHSLSRWCEQADRLWGLPRLDALNALLEVAAPGNKRAIAATAARLTDVDPDVRQHAIDTMSTLAPGNRNLAIEKSSEHLTDIDWRTRNAARKALVVSAEPGFADSEAMKLCAQALEHDNWAGRRGAAMALRHLAKQAEDGSGIKKALDMVMPKLHGADWTIRRKSVQALASLMANLEGKLDLTAVAPEGLVTSLIPVSSLYAPPKPKDPSTEEKAKTASSRRASKSSAMEPPASGRSSNAQQVAVDAPLQTVKEEDEDMAGGNRRGSLGDQSDRLDNTVAPMTEEEKAARRAEEMLREEEERKQRLQEAREEAERVGRKRSLQALAGLAHEPDDEVRIAVMQSLPDVAPAKSKEAVAVACMMATSDIEPQVRIEALKALTLLCSETRSRTRSAIWCAAECLEDEDAEVKSAAVEALGAIGRGRRTAVDAATKYLSHADEKVRMAASEVFKSFMETHVTETRAKIRTMRLLRHQDETVRKAAEAACKGYCTSPEQAKVVEVGANIVAKFRRNRFEVPRGHLLAQEVSAEAQQGHDDVKSDAGLSDAAGTPSELSVAVSGTPSFSKSPSVVSLGGKSQGAKSTKSQGARSQRSTLTTKSAASRRVLSKGQSDASSGARGRRGRGITKEMRAAQKLVEEEEERQAELRAIAEAEKSSEDDDLTESDTDRSLIPDELPEVAETASMMEGSVAGSMRSRLSRGKPPSIGRRTPQRMR